MAATDDPMLGRTVAGRYRIDGILGRGGMGAVYRAHQLGVERDVALKVLRHDLGKPSDVRRFEAEARIIARLRHPHTVRLIDFGPLDDDLFLVLELVGGGSLKERIKAGDLDMALALELCAQVADALGEAHGLGVVHRDLKPANIVVERIGDREVARILDFGVAHVADGATLTRTGALIGTPAYMAPEQVRGMPVTPATDLYALGVTLFEALTGIRPFRAEGTYALMMKHVEAEPPALEPLLPSSPPWPEVAALVRALLAKDPAERPPTAGAVRDRLRALINRLPRAAAVPADRTLTPAPEDSDSWERSGDGARSGAGDRSAAMSARPDPTAPTASAERAPAFEAPEASGAPSPPDAAPGPGDAGRWADEAAAAPGPPDAAPAMPQPPPAVGPPQAPPDAYPGPPPTRPGAWLAALAALVVTLAGLAGWLLVRGPEAPTAPPAAMADAAPADAAPPDAASPDAARDAAPPDASPPDARPEEPDVRIIP